MRRLLLVAGFLIAPIALGEDLSGRVLLSFQRYDLDRMMTSGLRQTYDVQWQRAFSTTTLFRLAFRADDFRGSTETPLISEDSRSR
jgi:hypothetical protein